MVPSEYLRNAVNALYLYLSWTARFNYAFDYGGYQGEWAKAVNNTSYTKGPFKQPGNYRQITVSNAFSKVFETVLKSVLNYLRQACKNPFQNGVRNDHCIIDTNFISNWIIIIEKHSVLLSFFPIETV